MRSYVRVPWSPNHHNGVPVNHPNADGAQVGRGFSSENAYVGISCFTSLARINEAIPLNRI